MVLIDSEKDDINLNLEEQCTSDDSESDEDDEDYSDDSTDNAVPVTKSQQEMKRKREEKDLQQRTSWTNNLYSAFASSSVPLLTSRAGRAAMIHNFLRGVSLQKAYPISPFTSIDEDDSPFKEIHQPLQTQRKRLYMVDSGLTFNSPYPLLMRPQRGVEIYLSFDFSARETDATPPFTASRRTDNNTAYDKPR